MNTSVACRALLEKRDRGFKKIRQFFAEKNVLEVDCPALSLAASIDLHIDVMTVQTGSKIGYLHTSPEYGMKKLLSQGSGDIYQLSHVFRQEEEGRLHRPEFMMLEWYRTYFSLEKMIEETLSCLSLFLPSLPHQILSYRDLLNGSLGIDPFTISLEELRSFVQALPASPQVSNWDHDTLLQFILSMVIEPSLGKDHFVVVTHFPASQAALAKIKEDERGNKVALRFEIYYKGIELANGYEELIDPVEQKKRLHAQNEARKKAGKQEYPIDFAFIKALEKGLSPCCGVALGFDRALLLETGEQDLSHVLPPISFS